MNGADVLRVLRGNLPLLIVLVIVAAAIGYAINQYVLLAHYSKYTAKGLCQVEMPANANLLSLQRGGIATNDILIEQRTQVQRLRNEALYSQVLQSDVTGVKEIRDTSWFKSFKDPREARQSLLNNFSASAIPESRLIVAEMQYSDPEAARIIVEAVIAQHIFDQNAQLTDDAYIRRQQMDSFKTRYDNDLRNLQRDMKDVADDVSKRGLSATPTPGGTLSPTYAKQAEITRQLGDANESLAKVNGQLNTVGPQLEKGEVPPMLNRMVEQDPSVQQLTNELRQLDLTMGSDQAQGVDSPGMKRMRAARDNLSSSLSAARTEALSRLKLSYIDELKTSKSDLEARQKTLTADLQTVQTELAAGGALIEKYRVMEDRQRELIVKLQSVNAAIDGVAQGNNSQPTIDWVPGGHPIKPDVPSFPKLGVTLTMAITLGIALSLTIAFARELLDTSIRSPRDVAKVGPIPVLGTVSHEDDDPQAAGSRLPLLIADAPHSMTAEQLRQLRTRLQHSSSLDTTRSLMITSPNPGDGKTTIASNLAAGLALVGRRILFVDANFRRPELHKLFGVDNAQGFAQALADPSQLGSLVKETKIPNLSVLPSGPKVANATEILEGSNLHDFIEKALETYDHVIFDSGPLLFSSEAVAMAPRVDGVVTVLRARQSTRGVLGRVRETLRQLKAENLGVVLNGVRSHGGGYYGRNIKTFYEYAGNGTGV